MKDSEMPYRQASRIRWNAVAFKQMGHQLRIA